MKSLPVLLLTLFAGPALALTLNYRIEPSHTYPSFEASHLGISVWRGKFNRSSGRLLLDRDRRSGSVEVRIEADSIDFGNEAMNEQARGERWLRVAQFPGIHYQGELRFEGDQPVAVDGELSLLGVERPLRLQIRSFRCITHPLFRREVCGADASGEFDRTEFGMVEGADFSPTTVRLAIQVEAMREDALGPRGN